LRVLYAYTCILINAFAHIFFFMHVFCLPNNLHISKIFKIFSYEQRYAFLHTHIYKASNTHTPNDISSLLILFTRNTMKVVIYASGPINF
jgi:hypothetical protein